MGSGQSKSPQQNAPVVVPEIPKKNEVPLVGNSTESPSSSEVSQEGSSGGGCPMKRGNGSYSYNIGALLKFGRDKHPPIKPEAKRNNNNDDEQTPQNLNSDAGGGCPVKHKAQPPPSTEGGCPVKHNPQQQQYNVYSQPIDPKNQMPNLNQLPAPVQKEVLPTDRVKSTIPKGGADDSTTWTYPSPQMFYNALARKGKLGDTEESDIESVVALHNNMNEKTWNKVLEWERVLSPSSAAPKLLKFLGRPSDLSPKAQFKHWFMGHPLPFDRHDWTVLRDDGTEVRYVIDYYHDETLASESEDSGMPHMHDFEATPSLVVDVRPALDGPTEFVDRCVRMPYARRVAKTSEFEPLPMFPTTSMKTQVGESLKVWESIQKNAKQSREQREDEEKIPDINEKEAVALAKSFAGILKDCREAKKMVDACDDEDECAKASMALTICMAKILCPIQNEALVKTLNTDPNKEKDYDSLVDAALQNVSLCVTGANQRITIAKKVHPNAFEGISK